MFVPKNRGFKRQYVYGGAGIFDSIASSLARLFTSDAARQIASSALDVGKSAAKELGQKTFDVGKSAAKELGQKAFDVGKTAALDAGKKLVEKGVTKVLTPKSQSILQKHLGMQQSSPDAVATKVQDILSKYIGAPNINSAIDACGMHKAIAIQDLVRKLNQTTRAGSGLKKN